MLKRALLITIFTLPMIHGLPISQYPYVCFTPNKKCQSQILDEIDEAKKSIRIQAYSFTDKSIANALGEAVKRGVDVKVVLDKSNVNDDRSAKSILAENSIPYRFDFPIGIAHNKVMIIDDVRVITGSYNFSDAAHSRNTENLLIFHDAKLASSYVKNWDNRWGVSRAPGEEK